MSARFLKALELWPIQRVKMSLQSSLVSTDFDKVTEMSKLGTVHALHLKKKIFAISFADSSTATPRLSHRTITEAHLYSVI